MKTIGTILDENKGIAPGFEFLRIFLALSVLTTHSFLIAQGERQQFSHAPLNLLHESILPMFFALSGFLITGSAMRLKLRDFLLNRSIRIVPALAVDILISALIIGPIFTTFTLGEYFKNYEFRAYFTNILGIIHYILPGVFEKNPFPATVNGSLWTVPFEIGCYIIMSLFILTGAIKRPVHALLIALTICTFVGLAYSIDLLELFKLNTLLSDRIRTLLSHYFSNRGNKLYAYFTVASLFYVFRYKIHINTVLLLCCLTIFTVGAFNGLAFLPNAVTQILYILVIVYLTIYIGLSKIPPLPIFRHGDYSYGIYLYGYPLQQALVTLFNPLRNVWLHLATSIPLVTLVAMFSWHFIEKPILRLRRKFSFTARKGDDTLTLPKSN